MFRIQKLLLYEYREFKEAVLVESPFAQVNELGLGIKQVQIALTASKLLIGHDTFDPAKTEMLSNVFYERQDPEIESLELVSMLPLEFLYIKMFRKGNRQLMKISVGVSKILWFEFGGHILKNMYWNIWRERISSLRASQARATLVEPNIPRLPPSPSSTTSTAPSQQIIPEPQQIVADVHRGNSESSHPAHSAECTSPLLKIKDLIGYYKLFPKSGTRSGCYSRQSRCDLNCSSEVGSCDQEMVLREVAEYFLETQSDIVFGQHSFNYDSCEASCRDYLFRSASVANMVDSWNNNYHGY